MPIFRVRRPSGDAARRLSVVSEVERLISPEPGLVAVLHSGSPPTEWPERFPAATIHAVAVTGDIQVARETIRQHAPFDLVLDDLADEPKLRKKTVTSFLPLVRDGGAYVVVQPDPGADAPPSVVTRFLRRLQERVDPLARTTDPAWVRDAVVRHAIADVTEHARTTVVRRRGDVRLADLAPYASVSDDGTTIDLGFVHRIHSVVLETSAPGPVTLLATNDGNHWLDVASARTTDLSAEARLEGKVWTRQLRAVPADGARIVGWQVLVRPGDARTTTRRKFVTSSRTDGLGERLNAMIESIRLARTLDLDLRFVWSDLLVGDPDHAIRAATEMFTESFRRDHLTEPEPGGILPLGADLLDREGVDRLLLGGQAVRCAGDNLSNHLDPADFPGSDDPYAPEFGEIGFAPDLLRAIGIALEIPLPERTAAVHLRGGDLVRGKFRQWARWTDKAVPLPMARAITKQLLDDGHHVLLTGQEAEVIDELHVTEGAARFADVQPAPFATATEQALFDLVLLSRCEPIVAGDSGFARQAAKLTGTMGRAPDDFMTPQEQHRFALADLTANGARYDRLHAAFAWWSAFHVVRHELDADVAVPLLQAAGRHDPANGLYPLTEAAWLYRGGRTAEGDAILAERLLAEWRAHRRLLLLELFPVRRFRQLLLGDQVEAFESVARDSAMAQLFLATVARVRLDVVTAHALAEQAAGTLRAGLLMDVGCDLVEAVLTSEPHQTYVPWQVTQRAEIADATAAWRAS